MTDLYKTIKNVSEGIYKEKGSKFIAIAFPCSSEENFKNKLNAIKKDYPSARHFCYAFRLGVDMKKYRFNDDGEPNNTAGKPIFGQIQSYELTNIAIVVIRYFGGTKLGVDGLITAYKTSAKDALNNATIIEKAIENFYEIQFEYDIMSDIMNFIKKQKLDILNQSLEEVGRIQFKICESKAEKIITQIKKIKRVKIKFLKSE